MAEWYGTPPDWKTLDALLRDPDVEGKEFCERVHYEDALALASEYRQALERIAETTASLSAKRIAKAALAVAPPSETTGEDGFWKPRIGDTVYLNMPGAGKADKPEGIVVGVVTQKGHPRLGQPIIRGERRVDILDPNSETVTVEKVMHPRFLLPFPHGSDEWKRALEEGRIVG